MTTRRAMIGANSIQAGGRDGWFVAADLLRGTNLQSVRTERKSVPRAEPVSGTGPLGVRRRRVTGSGRARLPPSRGKRRLGRSLALPRESWRNALLVRRAAGGRVLLLDLGLHVIDRLADGLDLLGLLV